MRLIKFFIVLFIVILAFSCENFQNQIEKGIDSKINEQMQKVDTLVDKRINDQLNKIDTLIKNNKNN